MSNTHSTIIYLPGNGIAFVDGIPDTCEHDSKGDLVYQSKSGKMIYWHTYKQWAHLTTEARTELIHEHHNKIDDPIIMGTTSCSKCKKIFSPTMY